MGLGEVGIHQVRRRRKEDRERRDKEMFERHLFMLNPTPYMGLSTRAFQHSNMKHMLDGNREE